MFRTISDPPLAPVLAQILNGKKMFISLTISRTSLTSSLTPVRLFRQRLCMQERMHITRRNSTFTFTTAQLPEKAGIDPCALLIDRIPDDNVEKNSSAVSRACTASKGRGTLSLQSRVTTKTRTDLIRSEKQATFPRRLQC